MKEDLNEMSKSFLQVCGEGLQAGEPTSGKAPQLCCSRFQGKSRNMAGSEVAISVIQVTNAGLTKLVHISGVREKIGFWIHIEYLLAFCVLKQDVYIVFLKPLIFLFIYNFSHFLIL